MGAPGVGGSSWTVALRTYWSLPVGGSADTAVTGTSLTLR